MTEAAVTGTCKIDGTNTMLVVLDYGFMGGSMSSVVGEKVALAFEMAARRSLPVVALVTGGGARTQEGVLSLMQMAKTVAAVNRLKEAGVPFIAVLANPSTGQAYASFANLADIIIAEPGSVVGLSPIRTMMEATGRPTAAGRTHCRISSEARSSGQRGGPGAADATFGSTAEVVDGLGVVWIEPAGPVASGGVSCPGHGHLGVSGRGRRTMSVPMRCTTCGTSWTTFLS